VLANSDSILPRRRNDLCHLFNIQGDDHVKQNKTCTEEALALVPSALRWMATEKLKYIYNQVVIQYQQN